MKKEVGKPWFRENSTAKLTGNQIVDELIKADKKKIFTLFIFLNSAKAFNMVYHKILLIYSTIKKMSKIFGPRTKCTNNLLIFESYTTNTF